MKSAVLLVLLFVATSASAGHKCNCGKDDPYAPGDDAIVHGGAFEGQCLNTCEKRSVKLLNLSDKGLSFANLYDHGDYYITNISPSVVPKVILQEEHFKALNTDKIAAHLEIRFHYDVGPFPTLHSQTDEQKAPIILKDLIYSAEYSAPEKVEFSIFEGVTKDFNIVYRIVSLYERYHSMIDVEKNRVEQFELEVPSEAVLRILGSAVSRGSESGMHFKYNTWSRSCATEAFLAIDEGRGAHAHLGTGSVTEHLPAMAEQALQFRHMKYKRLINLNDEPHP